MRNLLAWIACIGESNVEIGWSHVDIGLLVSFLVNTSQINVSQKKWFFSHADDFLDEMHKLKGSLWFFFLNI